MLCLMRALFAIHGYLPHPVTLSDSSCAFAHLIFMARLKQPCNFSWNSLMAFLPLCMPVGGSSVLDKLIKKHPDPYPVTSSSLVSPDASVLGSCHPVVLMETRFVILLFMLRVLQVLQQ